MSKPLSSAQLHLCHTRACIPGTAEERDRDYADTLHKAGPVLIQRELDRIKPQPESDGLWNRICQAVEILLGRHHVYVDRRHPRGRSTSDVDIKETRLSRHDESILRPF